MKRISLGDGRWLNADKARRWTDDTHWDGSNHISAATGSQWDRESLYLTVRGRWFTMTTAAHHPDRWTELRPCDAARWLFDNNYEMDAIDLLPDESAALEV